jgi:(p)ppGpp synthase/HD superfamily hydrolase
MNCPSYIRFAEARDRDPETVMQAIPDSWITAVPVAKALTLASFFHAGQIRKFSGLPTLIDHVVPVGLLAYDFASMYGYDPVRAAILGLLHDAMEDCNSSGFSDEYVQRMIFESFGYEIFHQLDLLTITDAKYGTVLTDKDKTMLWRLHLPYMWPETRIAKLGDIFSNSDKIPLRKEKKEQRLIIVDKLGSVAPVLRDMCLNDLRLSPLKD